MVTWSSERRESENRGRREGRFARKRGKQTRRGPDRDRERAKSEEEDKRRRTRGGQEEEEEEDRRRKEGVSFSFTLSFPHASFALFAAGRQHCNELL